MPPATEPRLRTRDAIALGLLHGPAELLPISSSGHVALVPWLLRWPYAELDDDVRKTFEVALHAGTVAALLVGLRGEVASELRALSPRRVRHLALTTLPPAVVGLACERVIERRLGTPRAIANGLAAGAVAMAAADACGGSARTRDDATDRDALLLGLAQACALAPGVSRTGATLTVARARGFGHDDAGVMSRHAALPVIAGGALLKGVRASQHRLPPGTGPGFAAGIAASFAATLASLRLVRGADRDRSLLAFAAYRIALAGLVHNRLRARCAAAKRGNHEIRHASDVSPPSPAAQ